MIRDFARLAVSAFGYDIVEPTNKRKRIVNRIGREDYQLKGQKHRQAQASAAELQRNLSLVGWMVRRHLDYVSTFQFRSRTGDKQFDKYVERLMAEDNRPNNADASGKFTREKLFRLAEMRRVLDGDVFFVKLNNGTLQGIQGDLVRDPPDMTPDDSESWINGISVNEFGRPKRFAVWRRRGYSDIDFLRSVRAQNVIQYGFFDRFATDQVRGVSPMISALAPLQDVYENFNYALAKAKVSQLFAVSFFREASGQLGELTSQYGTQADLNGDELAEPTQYDVNFGDSPQVFDLDAGDRAEFLESKSPSGEFQNFTQAVIGVALKSLDIPFSFFDESWTNFYGSRAAALNYNRAAQDKREDQIQMRRQYTVWKYQQWIAKGWLPPVSINDLAFEWIPTGIPWWDPAKEIKGNVDAIAAGLDTPQRVCRSTGSDFYENIDEIAAAIEYAKEKGVDVSFTVDDESLAGQSQPVNAIEVDETENEQTQNETEVASDEISR